MAAEQSLHPGEEPSDNEPDIRVVSADEMEPASVIADIPDSSAEAKDGKFADTQAPEAWPRNEGRWREIVVGFVDDPHGSVQAAAELVEDDVSIFATFLSQRREDTLNAGSQEDGAKTEQMRQLVVTYRDISRQLAASAQVCQLILAGHRGS